MGIEDINYDRIANNDFFINTKNYDNMTEEELTEELSDLVNEYNNLKENNEELEKEISNLKRDLTYKSKDKNNIRFEDFGLRIPFKDLSPKFNAYPLRLIEDKIIGYFEYTSINEIKIMTCYWDKNTGICKDTVIDFNNEYNLEKIK